MYLIGVFLALYTVTNANMMRHPIVSCESVRKNISVVTFYMYVHVCMYVYTCMYVCTCMYMYVYIIVHT